MSVTYCECECVWPIRHAMRMHHIVVCPAPLYRIFPHYLINGYHFPKKKVAEAKCGLTSSKTCV
jgi:hypothetical protein